MTDNEINEHMAQDPGAYSPPRDELMAIKKELRRRNKYVGPHRPEDRLERDAHFLHLHRHGGIEVETLCMMLTDLEFAASAYRKAMVERILTLGGTCDGQTK